VVVVGRAEEVALAVEPDDDDRPPRPQLVEAPHRALAPRVLEHEPRSASRALGPECVEQREEVDRVEALRPHLERGPALAPEGAVELDQEALVRGVARDLRAEREEGLGREGRIAPGGAPREERPVQGASCLGSSRLDRMLVIRPHRGNAA
jgi:hypothetical protein